MSRKSILNVTSRKKRDNLVSVSDVTATARPGTRAVGPAVMAGGSQFTSQGAYLFLWAATARDTTDYTGDPALVTDDAARTAKNVFMRGLRENVELQTNSGVPWQWRRILVSAKGLSNVFTTTQQAQLFFEDSTGYRRLVSEVLSTDRSQLTTLLFRGVYLIDWSDVFTAKVDNSRFTIHYDRTRTIMAGNDSGVVRRYNLWHPFNKTIVYNDDEDGGGMNASHFSTLGKPGMGDVFVIDLFQPRSGSATTDQLIYQPQASLYWHER